MYMELEEVINALEREAKKEKGLKNKCLFDTALNALHELKTRKLEK